MKKNLIIALFSMLSTQSYAVPKNYTFDPLHTAAHFSYEVPVGWTVQDHRFDSMSGKVVLDSEAKTGSVEATIDATSVNTGSSLFNGQIQGPALFDTARNPQITFKSREVKFEGDKPVSILGDLTIKGITKPVTFAVTSFVVGQHPIQTRRTAMAANAVAKVKRSDFNMLTSLPLVSDDVTISVTLQAFESQ